MSVQPRVQGHDLKTTISARDTVDMGSRLLHIVTSRSCRRGCPLRPVILTPVQVFAIINQLGLMLRTLVLVTAATALRISGISFSRYDSASQG